MFSQALPLVILDLKGKNTFGPKENKKSLEWFFI